MWFLDGPEPANELGTAPLAVLRYAETVDGLWAVADEAMARQQIDYPDQFTVHPDLLLQGEGYRLSEVARVALPESLRDTIGHGYEALNLQSHPFEPALVTVQGEHYAALRRRFADLRADVLLLRGRWLLIVTPSSAGVPVLG